MTTLEKIKNYDVSSGSAYQVFPKLRKDNYFTWSTSMKIVLEALNQWGIVSGELKEPEPMDKNKPTKEEIEIMEAWTLWKKRAYSKIMLRVEDEPRVSIMFNSDPKAAWDKLQLTYGTRLANSRAMLLSELV